MSSYLELTKSKNKFDSRIEHPGAVDLQEPFQFFLELRVHLRQINPKSGSRTERITDRYNHPSTIIPWDNASWFLFKYQYAKMVTQVWDKAFLLFPPKTYDGFVWPAPRGKGRDLLCRLNLKVETTPSHAHISIPVVRLRNPGVHSFRNNSKHYSSDIEYSVNKNFVGHTFSHNVAAHEVGHLLGLDHVNRHDASCLTGSEKSCYGSDLIQRMNIMGAGSKLSLTAADPWRRSILAHAPPTQYDDWTASWASADAILRGDGNINIDEQIPKPPFVNNGALIDI